MSNAVAKVYVNNVGVGALPANQYKTIVNEIRRDRRLFVAQLLNFLAVVFRFMVINLKVLPFFLFYLMCTGVLFSPESISTILTEIQKATPDEIVLGIRQAILVSLLLTIFTLFVASLFSNYRYGYVNQFDKGINKRIRNILEVPTEGDMSVIIVDGDIYHVQ